MSLTETVPEQREEKLPDPRPVVAMATKISRASLSLSLASEIESLRDELAKVAVLTLVEGYVNEASLLEVAPTIINKSLAGPITPFNDCAFLVPLSSREEVKEVCGLGSKVATKDGPCMVNLSPWSAEISADGRASGTGQWIHLWNMPLHGWCRSIISEVVKPVGELVALSQVTNTHKRFLSTLGSSRAGVTLPFEVELSLRMRKYTVLITGDNGALPVFKRELGRYVLPAMEENDLRWERRGTHEVPSGEKGKASCTGVVWLQAARIRR